MKINSSILGLLLVGILLSSLVTYGDYKQSSARRQAQMAREIQNIKGTIEITLQQYMTLILSLEAFVQANEDIYSRDVEGHQEFGKRFLVFADALERNAENIMSLQLAPSGIIKYLTQIERNGKAQNHDLLTDDLRRDQLIDVIRKRSIVVAGPLTLIQGGEALIVRKAIFTRPGAFDRKQQFVSGRVGKGVNWPNTIDTDFWGFATLIVGVDKLYSDLKLINLPDQYTYALRGRHSLGNEGDIFWGEALVFDNPDLTSIISLPAGNWVLAMKSHEPHQMIRTSFIFLSGLLLTLLATYTFYSHQSSLRARAASEASGRFLASMSHEIRTPMNGIIGVAQLLEKSNLDQNQRGLLDKILSSSKLLLRLVNDVLDFSKIESGSMQLANHSYSPSAIVDHAVSLVELEAQRKNLSIEVNYLNEVPPRVRGDEVRVQQILVNLLSNAVKFTDSGKVELSIEQVDQGLFNQLRFVVCDTGIGISEKEQKLLFQPFTQADSSTTKKYGGSGLGLVISRTLARQMGGEINVVSVPGQGSRFSFNLPLVIDSKPPQLPQTEPEQTQQDDSLLGGNTESISVLVVDDIEMNTQVAVMILEELGYEAETASSGQQAIDQVSSKDYDIIFMDRQMPEMDGLEVTRTIRQRLGSSDRPWIIAMTASAQEDEKQEYLDSGANDFIGKPIDFEQMEAKLLNYHKYHTRIKQRRA